MIVYENNWLIVIITYRGRANRMTLRSPLMMVRHRVGRAENLFCCLSFIISQPNSDLLPVLPSCAFTITLIFLVMGGGGRNKRMVQLRWWPPGRILLPFNERWEPVFSERSSKQLVSHPQLSFVPHFMKSLCPHPTSQVSSFKAVPLIIQP